MKEPIKMLGNVNLGWNHFYRNGSKPSAALYGLWRYRCFTANTNWLLNFTGLVATISLAMALRYGFRLVGLTSGYKHKWNRKHSGSLQTRFSSSEIAAFSFFKRKEINILLSLICSFFFYSWFGPTSGGIWLDDFSAFIFVRISSSEIFSLASINILSNEL